MPISLTAFELTETALATTDFLVIDRHGAVRLFARDAALLAWREGCSVYYLMPVECAADITGNDNDDEV